MPVASTWPCTRCPPSRPPRTRARSRFTPDPGRKRPRLVRCKVSGVTSTEKELASRDVTVRQAPLIARLSPTFVPWSVSPAAIVNRPALAALTVPTSSIMPVNKSLPFSPFWIRSALERGSAGSVAADHYVLTYLLHLDPGQAHCLGNLFYASTLDRILCRLPADDNRGDEGNYLVYQAMFKE